MSTVISYAQTVSFICVVMPLVTMYVLAMFCTLFIMLLITELFLLISRALKSVTVKTLNVVGRIAGSLKRKKGNGRAVNR